MKNERNENFIGITIAHTRIGLLSLFMLVAFQASAQGEDCVSLTDDTERLECFDAAFVTLDSGVTSFDEAISELRELVTFSDEKIDFSLSAVENSCGIETVLKTWESEWGNHKRLVLRSNVDLSNVERIGNWGIIYTNGIDLKDFSAITLIMKRGFTGGWENRFLNSKQLPTTAAEIDSASLPVVRVGEGREALLMLVVPEYSPDLELIKDSLQVAMDACAYQ